MFQGKENYITAEHLKNGEECVVIGYGQSMTPILKSGQAVKVIPINDIKLNKNDIVFCKVAGHYYLQLKMKKLIKYLIIMVM